ncbi:MAG TPA: NAD+ synthase [Candidatus Omnitrophota bacterium]|nr:NAD+ synthase [Candidatus Omnitrophota bacterium]
MKKSIRIGLAQINTTVGDLAGNQKKICAYIGKARQSGCDIVVFPELAITGYPPEDLLLKKHFIAANRKAIQAVAGEAKDIVAVVGFVDVDVHGHLYNAAAIIAGKKIQSVYRKNHLPNYGVFDEQRYFTCGRDINIFYYDGLKIGVSICEDIWQGSEYCKRYAKQGARILLNLSASPYHCYKNSERQTVLKACARTSRSVVCYCNLVGGQDELVFDGQSVILDSKGHWITSAEAFQEDLCVTDVLVETSAGRKGQDLKGFSSQRSSSHPKILITRKKVQPLSRIDEIYQALVLGTRDYVVKNGFQNVVIGLSGGIDSALVATIAKDALGPDHVLGVCMPSRYTSEETLRDARAQAHSLGICFQQIPIDELFSAYLKVLQPIFVDHAVNIAEENLQARIRGNLLMALSNKFGHLVLTTGNKSEIAVGYCTLYGDMAGGFAVIKDVPKTVVYQLARRINVQQGKEVILKSIIDRAPTAELKENQKDQDTLPAYDVLDAILQDYVENDKGLAQLKRPGRDAALIKNIVQLVDRMEYKRRQAPLGVKITPKAFGRDRRLPITNQYRER